MGTTAVTVIGGIAMFTNLGDTTGEVLSLNSSARRPRVVADEPDQRGLGPDPAVVNAKETTTRLSKKEQVDRVRLHRSPSASRWTHRSSATPANYHFTTAVRKGKKTTSSPCR